MFIIRDKAGTTVHPGASLKGRWATWSLIEATRANGTGHDGKVLVRKPDGTTGQFYARVFGLTVAPIPNIGADADAIAELVIAKAALDRYTNDRAWFPGPEDVARCLGEDWDVPRVIRATIELITSKRATLYPYAQFFARTGWLYVLTVESQEKQ